MSLIRTNSYFSKIAILLSSLLMTVFFTADANAQEQVCECYDNYTTTSVRRTPVRRAARRVAAKRTYRAPRRTTAVVRPVYQTVYVPVREVEVLDDDCDEVYTTANRVVVTDRVYTNGYNGRKIYTNGYNGNGYNGYVKDQVFINGRYGNPAVDADYFETRRIASDYGYRDGFNDGHEVALEREAYFPQKEGDFKNGTNGYEDDFGPKDLYKQAYREAYLRGYDAGFRSVAQSRTYRAVRW